MYYDAATNQQREHDRILARASKKYGGQTTSWRVTQQIKLLAQRFDIGDLITFKPTPGKGLHITMSNKVERRIGGTKFYQFIDQLMDTVYDCGYTIAVGDGFVEIVKI